MGKRSFDFSKAIESVTRSMGRADPMVARNIKVAMTWDSVAGELVASHTADAHLRQGEFIVYVDSPAWANDLSAMSEMYRIALNEAFGREIVKSVRFEVSNREFRNRSVDAVPGSITGGEPHVDPVPLSEIEMEYVKESVSHVKDPELREALLKATVADLEWKKGIDTPKTP